MNRLITLLVGLTWAVFCAAAGDPAAQLGLPDAAAAAMQGIDAERIRAHVKFLSDDLLEGRGTGTRGAELAADYIATQFALLGLQPAGDNGSYVRRERRIDGPILRCYRSR